MNRTFVGVVVAGTMAWTSGALAQVRTEVRQANQERRIENGVAEGSVNANEARRLERGQARVEAHQQAARNDGVVTGAERRSLERQQNRQSRRIARARHNAR